MQLPNGWALASIEQLSGSQGLTSDGDWIETKDQDRAGGVRLIQLADIGDGEFRDRSSRFVTTETAKRLNCTFLEAGDLLIARMPDPLGRACVFPGVGQPAITAVDVFIWRPSPDGPLARWLMHFVNSSEVRSSIAEQAGGTTRQRISGGRVRKLAVPVPPLPEQGRIVAKIDSLSAKSRRASDHLDHIPRLVEKYKQTILAAAFRGNLTRDLRPNSNPVWDDISVGDLFEWSSGKNLPSKRQAGGSIPVIGGNGVSGYHDTALIDFPTLVIGRVGAQCGNVHRSEGLAWITDNAIYARSISEKIALEFAILFFRVSNLNSLAGGTGQPYVNQTMLNELVMPVPSADEQRQMVRRVDTAFAWIDRLATEATNARKLIDYLDQAILAKAFQGEFVPQDPNDEPASALLERIRAERTNTARSPKAARSKRRTTAWAS